MMHVLHDDVEHNSLLLISDQTQFRKQHTLSNRVITVLHFLKKT